ncbi:MAG: glycosyltransferase family 87 protein [Gallionella sp.]
MKKITGKFLPKILNAPYFIWVMIGFLTSYLLFFIYPVFLSGQVMQFTRYVPAMDPIGADLMGMLSYSESWFVAKQTPYIGHNLYPPLASVLFTPLLSVGSTLAYKIVTLFSVFCYVIITFVFPMHACRDKTPSSLLLLMLVFITGLFSYGFQFELERGQFNVIAIFMCFLGIWICHNHNKYRHIGYILFTISVQLKIYPLIFIVMLIRNWHDWRNNVKRLLILATANFALFFVLGLNVFLEFITAIKLHAPVISITNHTVTSFVTMGSRYWSWMDQYSGLTQFALLALIFVCIFAVILQAYRHNQEGINPNLGDYPLLDTGQNS